MEKVIRRLVDQLLAAGMPILIGELGGVVADQFALASIRATVVD
jgi:hypothetical protein